MLCEKRHNRIEIVFSTIYRICIYFALLRFFFLSFFSFFCWFVEFMLRLLCCSSCKLSTLLLLLLIVFCAVFRPIVFCVN